MREFLNLVLSGLVTGAIYSIMASGLILTYTTSGIFNFAHGAVAFVTAYLYYQLNTGVGLPILPSLLISVFLFAPLLGLLLDRILLRRLAKAPVYARIVGSIGLLVMLPALAQWLVVTVGNDVLGWDLPGNQAATQGVPVPGIGPAPATNYTPLKGIVLNSDQLAVFVIAALSAVVLWYVIRRTRKGLEMRAVVDRDQLAGLRGINANRTSATAWILTMILAGMGGVLIAPLFGLQDFTFTLVVLGSLAVVVLGGLRSIPIAFAGGLALGVVQNLVAGYSNDVLPSWLADLSGLKAAVPFILTVVLLLIFGRDRSRRAGSVADDVPRPDHRQGLSRFRRRACWVAWTIALIVYSLQWINVSWLQANGYGQTVIAQGLAMAIIFLSFVVVTGFGGMVSLAQATFVTVGGFVAGWALSRNWGIDVPGIASHGKLNFFFAVVLAAVAAGLVGMLIALPMTKLGGVSLALGTLAIAFIASLVIFPVKSIGKLDVGWKIRSPKLDIPGMNQLVDLLVKGHQKVINTAELPVQILLFLAVFGVITGVIHLFSRSASGRAILAVRSSEVAAESVGIRVNRVKVMIFGFGAAIAGVGGVMLGLFSFGVSQTTAPPLIGLFWLAIVVTFGVRRPGGALLAGLAFTCGTAVFNWIGSALPGDVTNQLVSSIYFVPILSGLGAINLAQEPDGLLALSGQRKVRKDRAKRLALLAAAEAELAGTTVDEVSVSAAVAAAAASDSEHGSHVGGEPGLPTRPTSTTAVVELENVIAGYGDVQVLHGVDLHLEPGTITALLGANGAGKSTLCGVIAGSVPIASGIVRLNGEDVTTVAPFGRANGGLFFVPEARGIFPGLTVEENLSILLRTPEQREIAYERFSVLGVRRKQSAGLLSGGEQQMLSLVPAMVAPPKVLIADEPTLGLAPLVGEAVMDAIGEIRDQGTAVLLVEEHARNALGVADTLSFLELGHIVWSGRPDEADLTLLSSAYLGRAAGEERAGQH